MSKPHKVLPGECLESIAHRNGLLARTVWEHPDNAPLRERRESRNVLLPGDVVAVPEPREKELDAATGKRHRFRRLGVPAKLRVQILEDGEPIAGVPYRYEVGGAVVREGKTDGEGRVDEWITPDAEGASLVLRPGAPDERSFGLRVGHLDPVSTASGLRGRLVNLGYLDRLDDDDDQVLLALCLFQEDEGLRVTGTCDDPTAAKLVDRHGS